MNKWGEHNGMWKGDAATKISARERARRLFSNKQPCEICGKDAEIHHRDGNPFNNEATNISWLCRFHHMEVDGRLEQLIARGGAR